MNARRKGFIMTEVLIIVVVIAFLVAVVVTLQRNAQKANEIELSGDLLRLREYIAQFKEDHGAFPMYLDQVMPYFLPTGSSVLPNDPFTGESDWQYNSETGEVHSACTWRYTLEAKYQGGNQRISDL